MCVMSLLFYYLLFTVMSQGGMQHQNNIKNHLKQPISENNILKWIILGKSDLQKCVYVLSTPSLQ